MEDTNFELDLRTAAVQALGGKCAMCGWSADLQMLQIMTKDGNSNEYKGRHREKFHLKVLQSPDPALYEVLCPNCKQLLMKQRRAEQAAAAAAAHSLAEPEGVDPKTLPVFVWASSFGFSDSVETSHQWIDKHVNNGHEAYIWLTDERRVKDGPVYRYGQPQEPVAANWHEFTERAGLEPAKPPNDAQLVARKGSASQ
jgi:hypothetical protein